MPTTFQMGFAIVTVALISGSVADRARMRGWLVFVPRWLLVVYAPAAHWVFAPDGWIHDKLGTLDFAGGLPVELNSGAAGLAVAIALRGPRDWARREERPNNIPLVVIGVGLLWFGWFGFNSGSALSDQGTAAAAFLNTQLGGAAAMVTWPLVEKWRTGRVSTTGVVSAGVAGMVAITLACGEINSLGAVITGLVAGLVCAFAVTLKYRFGVDDTLDVVGVHGVGGVTGREGLFYGGGWSLLGQQVLAVLAVGTVPAQLDPRQARRLDGRLPGRRRVPARPRRGGRERIRHLHRRTPRHLGQHRRRPQRQRTRPQDRRVARYPPPGLTASQSVRQAARRTTTSSRVGPVSARETTRSASASSAGAASEPRSNNTLAAARPFLSDHRIVGLMCR